MSVTPLLIILFHIIPRLSQTQAGATVPYLLYLF